MLASPLAMLWVRISLVADICDSVVAIIVYLFFHSSVHFGLQILTMVDFNGIGGLHFTFLGMECKTPFPLFQRHTSFMQRKS